MDDVPRSVAAPTIAPGWYWLPGANVGYWDGHAWDEQTIGRPGLSALAVASLVTAILHAVMWLALVLWAVSNVEAAYDSYVANRGRWVVLGLLGPLVPFALGSASLAAIDRAKARGRRPLQGRAMAGCGTLMSLIFWFFPLLLWIGFTTGD